MPSNPTLLTPVVTAASEAVISSASFTPVAGEMILVFCSLGTPSSAGSTTLAVSDSMGGLSWTQVNSTKGTSGNLTAASIFYATATGVSGTVTVTPSRTGAATSGMTLSVYGVTGAGTVGATGSSTGSATVTLSAAPASSSLVVALMTNLLGSDPAQTIPSGHTSLFTDRHVASTDLYDTGSYDNVSASQTLTWGGTVSNAAAVAFEITQGALITQQVKADFSGTAFGSSPTWTDITSYVMTSPQEPNSAPVQVTWGRQDWFSAATPTTFSFTLRNIDGRFTPGRAHLADGVTTNPLYPYVKFGVRVQVLETIGSTVNYADGYITDITAVPQNGIYWTVQVNCTDIFGRMGTTTNLQGYLVEEMLLDSPLCLYAMQEAEGSTSFGDLTGNQTPLVVTNSKYGAGSVQAGQTPTGLGLVNAVMVEIDNATSYASSSTGPLPGTWLSGPSPNMSALTSYTVEIWVQTATTAPNGSGNGAAVLWIPSASTALNFLIFPGSGEVDFSPGGIPGIAANDICDGNFHHLVGVVSGSSYTLYVDSVAHAGTGSPPAFGPVASTVTIGSQPTSQAPLDGGVAFFAVYPAALSAARVLAHYNAGSLCAPEITATNLAVRTDQRIATILSFRANTGSTLDTGLGYVGTGDCVGETQQQTLLDTSFAEGGTIYADGSGQIVFRNRANNFNPTPVLTLDASLGQVDVPSTFRDDVQLVLNDVTVSRPNGSDQRAFNQASINQQGDITNQVTANVDTDQHALDLGYWMVGAGIQDQLGIPTLTVDLWGLLHNGYTTVATEVLQLRPLDCVTVINLPGVSPASTMSVQVQGGTYTRTSESLSISLFCTPNPALVDGWDVATPNSGWDETTSGWAY